MYIVYLLLDKFTISVIRVCLLIDGLIDGLFENSNRQECL